MEQLVTLTSFIDLECKDDAGSEVILCVDPDMVAPVDCDGEADETIQYSFIEATLESYCKSSPKCGAPYTYTFKYDDIQLTSYDEETEQATEILLPLDIIGVFCKDCLTTWLEQKIGGPASLTVEDGTVVFVSGQGCRYEFDVEFILSVDGTQSVDLTLDGNTLTADVIISEESGNLLQEVADGLLVEPLLSEDTDSILLDIQVASLQQTISAELNVDDAANNLIEVSGDGVLVPDLTVDDTNSISHTYAGRELTSDVNISGDADNIIEIRGNGLYAADSGSLSVDDTNSIDLTLSSGVITADLNISAVSNNIATVIADGLYVPPPDDPEGSWYPGSTMFGSGEDGDRTVTGDELIPYPVRDMFYENLTINDGDLLEPFGYFQNNESGDPEDRAFVRIYVNDTLTIAGSISADGANGSGAVGAPLLALDGSGGGNSSGGDGGVGESDSSNFSNGSDSGAERDLPLGLMAGGMGGPGGEGGVYAGAGGSPRGYPWLIDRLVKMLTMVAPGGDSVVLGGGGGGAGGGGGGRDYSSSGGDGGGGGAGGGVIFIIARSIVLEDTGTISANGGDGANGSDAVDVGGDDADGGGGGGGGGGGMIYLIYESFTDNGGTIEALGGSGGAGGAPVNFGEAGQNGDSGLDGNIFRMKFPEGTFQ